MSGLGPVRTGLLRSFFFQNFAGPEPDCPWTWQDQGLQSGPVSVFFGPMRLEIEPLVGRIAGSTISAKLSAVKAWHIQNNQPWHGNILLQYVLKGTTNAMPDSSKQDCHLPITTDMLKDLVSDLDMAAHLDAAIYAVATMAFYGQLRLGEICSNWEVYNTFNCKTLPNLSHLKPPHTPAGSHMLHTSPME